MAPESEAVTEPPPAKPGEGLDVAAELAARLPPGTQRVRYRSRRWLRPGDFIDHYVAWWIRHPDPGSRFDKRTRWMRRLPDMALISLLRLGRYDGLIYHRDGTVLMHIFYVQKGADVHPFSLAVADEYQGRGLAKWLFLSFVLEYAPTLPGARRCRVGADGHWLPIVVAEALRQDEGRLPVSIDSHNWVTFHSGGESPSPPARQPGRSSAGSPGGGGVRLDLQDWFPPLGGGRDAPVPGDVFTHPVIYSQRPRLRRLDGVDRYILEWLKRPDPGSRFERESRRLRWLPGRLPLWMLAASGYEALIYVHEDRVLAHVFLVRVEDELRVFHVYVDPALRGRDVGWRVALSLLDHARTVGAAAVRIGAGGDRRVRTLWKTIRRFEGELGVRVDLEEGRIEILGEPSPPA